MDCYVIALILEEKNIKNKTLEASLNKKNVLNCLSDISYECDISIIQNTFHGHSYISILTTPRGGRDLTCINLKPSCCTKVFPEYVDYSHA